MGDDVKIQGVSGQDVFYTFVDGKQAKASCEEWIDVVCPSDAKKFASIPRCGASDVGRAVTAARRAFETGEWPKTTSVERGRLLTRLSQAIEAHKDELAALEARDTGKPVMQGVADVRAAVRYFEFYGGAADKVTGETLPSFVDDVTTVTIREPHGVVGAVIPWNYPIQIFSRVAGAALAMGNTLVIKPSEDACLSVIRVAELAKEVGFPDGVLNIVTGYGDEAGAALAHNPGLDFITFTGSPQVGTIIQSAAAKNHIGCTLELGGKSPQILFEDADLDKAIPVICDALTRNGGQTCSAGSRVLVHKSLWDEVASRLRAKFRALVTGPHEHDLDIGALINPAQARRVENFCSQAAKDGIPLIAEGTIAPDAPEDGFYCAARLYGPVPIDHPLAQDEVFGPVLSLIPFEGEEEAIQIANGTPYGLVAGVWTANFGRAMRVAKAVRAGQVFVNAYGAGGGVEFPFGGFKKSGHGREKGFEALKDFSALKTLVLKHD
ncbi:aldehyde dehydrogenase family protein [Rhodobacteraceae bacterium RKSG542]|uniref:aldehyde dehydrogenase family protein n=1 Tax=Pseudovibrio flavus TaxID=2529854 RepID=UPI0012BBE6BB|nr:aldehyde dehydrogenase family protein [Pseudovibrio flavus]MTI17079.1 aldehyde dehydrogenase family protein [Pseudovibrio flavus]